MKTIKTLTLSLALITILSGCQKSSDKWMGFSYLNRETTPLSTDCNFREFETKVECEAWGKDTKETKPESDYYCGFECNYSTSCEYACSGENSLYCTDYPAFKNENWYSDLLNQLSEENNIDKEGARWIQMLSSQLNPGTAEEIINKQGKINENNILQICHFRARQEPKVLVITKQLDLSSFFAFEIEKKKLFRAKVLGDFMKNIVITSTEKLRPDEIKDDVLTFYANDTSGEWSKTLRYDFKENTIQHSENCKTSGSEKECKPLNELDADSIEILLEIPGTEGEDIINNTEELETTPEYQEPKEEIIETQNEYPFEKCGKLEEFEDMEWYNALISRIPEIHPFYGFYLPMDLWELPAEPSDIVDVCFSDEAQRIVLITHKKAEGPITGAKIAKYAIDTDKLSLADAQGEFHGFVDSIRFGKRFGNFIEAKVSHQNEMYLIKETYNYYYIENTFKLKRQCKYKNTNPDFEECMDY